MSKLEQALLDPTSVYTLPKDVLSDEDLSKEDKLKILRRWEYDERELQIADEENMAGDESASFLDQVLEAIRSLE